jgi:hypothetical protein
MTLIFVYNTVMEFREFLDKKYLEWRGNKIANEGSIASWARSMDLSPQLLSTWMNRGSLPSPYYINKLASVFGYEVYDVLGLELPKVSPAEIDRLLDTVGVPREVSDKIAFLLVRAHSIAEQIGISIDSPEGHEIIKNTFLEAGFDFRE